ncbi:3-oxoacyl-[acyl-carrier-protein] synthase, KASIII [Actinokineospora spheciospongiae]|uniref:3-oxoacyl-[acyl-carrier-protein] synthase, KASIII n=1 Tax=Actinokineospora spheciospongiae TaxID=909613 RepID=W7ISU5_9PSEU|nr:ketoacyl-ACP synthase III [Actinokineospora spheciospongiae]EWC64005.1 3-oxoacyl-[acyl-carrier-protein] synthase, KASIII [Actinokineospora spheciospongiae]
MATTSAPGVGLLGCGAHLPDEVLDNETVAAAAGVEPGWIERKTGVLARRRAAQEDASSDLAARAAREALRDSGVPADRLSLVVVATSTPDSPQPPTASLVQHLIGATGAAAFDVNAVCSGFVFALETARAMLRPGGYALVVGVDIYTRIVDPSDRRTAALFGDGAGAVVLGPVEPGRGVLATGLTSRGDLHGMIGVPAGGSRIPPSKDSLLAGEHWFTMDGRGVREFVAAELPAAVAGFLAEHGVPGEAVDHFVPHQANLRMLDEVFPTLGLPNARSHHTVAEYGNTGAASVPITLAAARDSFRPGETVLLAAFGGGMAIGLSLLRW